MIKTGQNIERITRKMGPRIKHDGNRRIRNMISMARNCPRGGTASGSNRVKNAEVTIVMGTANAIRSEAFESTGGVVSQPSGDSHVKFGISGGQRIKLNESPDGIDKMGKNRKGKRTILVDTWMLAELGLDILLTSTGEGASVKK
jgi:hypothetical protein